jgi:hypothetical protein
MPHKDTMYFGELASTCLVKIRVEPTLPYAPSNNSDSAIDPLEDYALVMKNYVKEEP